MVAEIIPPTKTSGIRPPFLPPIDTTYSQEPDDERQDMLVFIRDSVDRLVRQAKTLDPESIAIFLALLDQRRNWIVGEMQAEQLLDGPVRAPLGIEEDPYDLGALRREFQDDRKRAFEHMVELIDATKATLESQLVDLKHDS
jgi:hypothetical protein